MTSKYEKIANGIMDCDIDMVEAQRKAERYVGKLMEASPFMEFHRVCLRSNPMKRGTVWAVGDDVCHVHWDGEHPETVATSALKETNR